MTARNVKNVAASVHQRLLNVARQTGRPFNELLQYYAIERFTTGGTPSGAPSRVLATAETTRLQ
jgi:hypothetical protein